MHTAQDGEPAGSLSYETDPLVRIDLTTYSSDHQRRRRFLSATLTLEIPALLMMSLLCSDHLLSARDRDGLGPWLFLKNRRQYRQP
jgi:hypothetical protein